jgi:hypothetical protein
LPLAVYSDQNPKGYEVKAGKSASIVDARLILNRILCENVKQYCWELILFKKRELESLIVKNNMHSLERLNDVASLAIAGKFWE